MFFLYVSALPEEGVFYKASTLILHEFTKMSGKFVSIGLVKISFPVEEIYTAELGDEIRI